jgi:two-component system response regulator PilR (NtrC family)
MTVLRAPRLLVVEDEPEILLEVSGYLRRRGELVQTAPGYSEAMRVLDDPETPIDFLLTDARMPDGSGLDLIRHVLAKHAGRVPCLLMTGHIEQADLSSDFEAAGVRIILKPFSLSAMYREVRALLGGAADPATVGKAA